MDVIASVPCYCDIQFEKQEYFTVLNGPNHPFTYKINELSKMIQ
jgi:chromosome partitioning protein